MKVCIAGATGAIGRPLVRQLRAAGHEVVGITRSEKGAEALRAAGAEPALADVFNPDALRIAVDRAGEPPDVVVNELTDLGRPLNPRKYAEWLEGTNRLRTEGTRNLIEAAKAGGMPRLVSQSVAFAYSFERGLKTEDSPLLGEEAGEMSRAIAEVERQTLEAGGIVLRYGFFYGPGTGYDRDGQQIELIRKRRMPIVGGGNGRFPFIHVEDAAAATVAAIERGGPGVYNVVDDDPAAARDWIPYVADLVGAGRPRRVPGFLARLVVGRLAVMATKLQPVSNANAKQHLGWAPRYVSWRDGFRAELAGDGSRAESDGDGLPAA